LIDTIIIVGSLIFSILGWLTGFVAILGYYGVGDAGGEFGWVTSLGLFWYFGISAAGMHLLSILLSAIHFFRERFIKKQFHTICILSFILSFAYIIYYSLLIASICLQGE